MILFGPVVATPSLLATPWYEVGGQFTATDQQLFPFRSPYSGTNSLQPSYQNALTHTYSLYLGVRPIDGLELYADPEMAMGYGLSGAVGLAGVSNGDVIRQGGGAPLPGFAPSQGPWGQDGPYLGRAFVRAALPLGTETEDVPAAENQIAGHRATSRLQLTAGKLGVSDIFDVNSYANTTRTQFENWGFINNPAWDYAADTRGYTLGAALEWIHPNWTLRAGSFLMPTTANGKNLDTDLAHAHGDQVELEVHPTLLPQGPTVVRLLGYLNHAAMGNYATAIADAKPGQAPDITATRQVGALKYGAGLNLEQPLADNGDTGVFARLGLDDGQTESFAYTEANWAASVGSQISGSHWHRPDDRLGLALGLDGLSAQHAVYLAGGGLGFLLGDGKLHYAPETIFEGYYAWHVGGPLTLSLDYQLAANPGDNIDRGPVSIIGARLHLEL